MLKIDGHDNAIIGVATPWIGGSRPEVLVYDADTIAENLIKEGMTFEEAQEYISFNIEGAYVGEDTPIIVWKADPDEYS